MAGDRNDFTLSGLGRIWIRKSYGGSQFQPTWFHSTILIDGEGMGVGDPDGDKHTMVGLQDRTDESQQAAGDEGVLHFQFAGCLIEGYGHGVEDEAEGNAGGGFTSGTQQESADQNA